MRNAVLFNKDGLKRCPKCKLLLSKEKFNKSSKYKSGYSCWCKDCINKISAFHENKDSYKHRRWALNTIKTHSKREGYTVNISIEELQTLAKNTKFCSYCGRELNWERGTKGKSPKSENPTLDRIYNSNIMNLSNCKIVCMRCNTTKGYHTMKEFIEYCRSVVNHYDNTNC